MAVISVTTLTVKPDKYEAFLDQNRKAKTILERCGATNVRLMGTIVAGEASGHPGDDLGSRRQRQLRGGHGQVPGRS
jgi:hypothetical protein